MHQHDEGGKGTLPHGAFTRIARRLRPPVSVQHVREVWLGNRKSARVERAIQKYRLTLQESDTLPVADTDSAKAA